MTNAKAPVGRPTKYQPEFCDTVIEAGREGCGKAEIAAELDVTRETVNEWAKEHPEFSDAIHRAHELSLAWWEKQARTNLATSGYQSGLWKQAMSGRFPLEPYRERQEVTGANGGPIRSHQLTDRVGGLPKPQRDAIRAAVKAAMDGEKS